MKLPETQFDHVVYLDFESFYDADFTLKKQGTEGYVRDERFETIGVGVAIDDGPVTWMEHAAFKRWEREQGWDRLAVVAHHAHFDGLISAWHYAIRPAFWFCTLSMGRALHGTEVGGSLEKLAVYYGAGEKGHEVIAAKGKRRRDFTPEEYARYGDYCCNDVTLMRSILKAMIAAGFPEVELWQIDTTIRMFTEPTLRLKEALLQEFLTYEQKRKAELLARVAKEKTSLTSNDKFAAILRSMGVEPALKRSPTAKNEDGTAKMTFAFAKSDPFMQGLLEHEEDEIRWLAEARVGVKSTINESRTGRFLRSGSGGRPVPVYLKYYGAHTGRWSGADRMNFQNLERVPKKIDPAKPYAGTLRKSLKAPAGRTLAVADSNAIEARKLAWLAGHTELVEGFARNEDVYSRFASKVYGRPIDRKKVAEDYIPGLVGKVAILGLGYQMGGPKFAATLASGPMGEKPIIFTAEDAEKMGVDVDDFAINPEDVARDTHHPGWVKAKMDRWRKVEAMPSRLPMQARLAHCAVAYFLVDKYRGENAPIVQLWKQMESVLSWMVDGDEVAFGPNDCLRTVRHGIVLPSGIVMRYPGLKRTREDHEPDASGTCARCGAPWEKAQCPKGRIHFSYISGHAKEKTHIYGGLLTENIVQALARIVVGEQMLQVRGEFGYHVATMTHDEIVLCVDEAEGPRAVERLIAAMKTPPLWAPGLPLNAEGSCAVVYGDAK